MKVERCALCEGQRYVRYGNGEDRPCTNCNEPALRAISYGGGVQSTALLVLAVEGKIGQVDAALFANVGDKSEHPATIEYVRNIAQPWAAARGLPVHELRKTRRDGSTDDLWDALMKQGSRSVSIPIRMANGAPGRRACTGDYKIKVVSKWLRAHGAREATPADVLIGISTDEIHRLHNRRRTPSENAVYPLIDLRLDRAACAQVIRDAGLPVPPKSACFFCPFHRPQTWAEQRRDEPDLFAKSQLLEDTLNDRRVNELGKDRVWLTRFNKRLSDAVAEAQTPLFHEGPESCDEGYCWT